MENDKLVWLSDVKTAIGVLALKYDSMICGDARRCVESIPVVDAVEMRHGEWIIDETFGSFACSICGSWHSGGFDSWRSPYCPKCGAKMDGEEKYNAVD